MGWGRDVSWRERSKDSGCKAGSKHSGCKAGSKDSGLNVYRLKEQISERAKGISKHPLVMTLALCLAAETIFYLCCQNRWSPSACPRHADGGHLDHKDRKKHGMAFIS